MALEDPDAIDAVKEDAAGKPRLIIEDSSWWADDHQRWTCLLDKLRSYIGYIYSDGFAARYPGVAPREVSIEIICKQPPSERMAQLTSFAPRGDASNRIAVTYTVLA